MEPDEAEDVRRLLAYDDDTAGGMMTTEPVILPPDATVAEALARVRDPELSPALAAQVYVVPPAAGDADRPVPRHRALPAAAARAAVDAGVGGVVDTDLEPLGPRPRWRQVTRYFATYNLVAAARRRRGRPPARRGHRRRRLDHLLPDDWRDADRRRRGRGRATRRPPMARERAAAPAAPPRPAAASRAGRSLRPTVDPEAVRRGSPSGSPGSSASWRFIVYMTAFIVVWVLLERLRAGAAAVRPVPVHLPHPAAVAAGLVRRAADPARAEPPGRPRPGAVRARTAAGTERLHRRHRVPHPRGGRAARSRLGEVATRDFLPRRAARPARRLLEERPRRAQAQEERKRAETRSASRARRSGAPRRPRGRGRRQGARPPSLLPADPLTRSVPGDGRPTTIRPSRATAALRRRARARGVGRDAVAAAARPRRLDGAAGRAAGAAGSGRSSSSSASLERARGGRAPSPTCSGCRWSTSTPGDRRRPTWSGCCPAAVAERAQHRRARAGRAAPSRVAVTDPTDVVALDDVRLHTGAHELDVVVATETPDRATTSPGSGP